MFSVLIVCKSEVDVDYLFSVFVLMLLFYCVELQQDLLMSYFVNVGYGVVVGGDEVVDGV